MASERMTARTIDKERTLERKAIVVGRLGDFKLGNPEGIPSRYADRSKAELQTLAEEKLEKLRKPTDTKRTGCIDGRKKKKNMDGSAPEVRYRRVGGSASNFGVAMNAEASVVQTLDPEATLGDQIKTVDEHMEATTGFERSAHTGGCGGAGGEIDDDKAIHEKAAILAATKAFMTIPEVESYLIEGHEADFTDPETGELLPLFDDDLSSQVQKTAGKTAQYLSARGWDGKTYVDGVIETNPAGVEDLEVDHDDHKFHGHKEGSILAVIGDETYAEDDDFVWNLLASKKAAEGLAGQRGKAGYVQALIAEFAKHIATSDRLASPDTPLIILDKRVKAAA